MAAVGIAGVAGIHQGQDIQKRHESRYLARKGSAVDSEQTVHMDWLERSLEFSRDSAGSGDRQQQAVLAVFLYQRLQVVWLSAQLLFL